jgi:3-oxoacyl-[acyl-carrier-protein] synthase III
MVSYHHLAGGDLLKKNDRILFLSAGSGLSASCALYTV